MVKIARCGCVSVCSCAIQGVDSECLATDVTGQGSLASPYQIEVNPIISTDTNNTLECRPNGLFAAGAAIVGDINNDGCVNTSVTENPDNTFTLEATLVVQPDSADPNGGPNPGNGLECTPTGALVAPSTEANNAIRYGTDGRLYVSPTAVEVDTLLTDCLDLQITGNGSPGQPFTISGTPIISPDAGNSISCTPNGLFVTPTNIVAIDNAQNIDVVEGPDNTLTFTCVPVPVVSNDPTCLSIGGDTCNGLVFDLNISPDPCNGLECRGNGLFVFVDPTDLPNIGGPVGNATFGPANGAFNVNFGPTICQTATNPSTCRSMRVDLSTSLAVDFGRTAGDFRVQYEISFNGPGGPFATDPGLAILNPTGAARQAGSRSNYGTVIALAPGASVTVCMRMRAQGNGTVNAQVFTADFNLDLHAKWID